VQLTFFEYGLAMAGSFLAGVINTLAGNGSVITLSLLTDLIGLPANMANGTNRVGVLLQTIGSSSGFAKNQLIDYSKSKTIIILTIVGAIGGVVAAIMVSNEQFLFIFKYLMLVMLLVILVKPERWLKPTHLKHVSKWISIPAFLLLGFYGGFIQMGMGIFFLAVTVLISGYSIMEANAIKTLVTAIYTSIVLAIFHFKGMVNWETGLIMAIGQTLGGYLTAAYASKWKDINIWAYRLLIIIIIFAILMQFKIIKL
jgi:uncharacterized membrane protein YfcA